MWLAGEAHEDGSWSALTSGMNLPSCITASQVKLKGGARVVGRQQINSFGIPINSQDGVGP